MTESPWRVQVARTAEKQIDRLDPPIRRRVVHAIRGQVEDPYSGSLRRLAGRPEWRLRVGDWRVIVELDPDKRTILVKQVLPRGRAYDR